MNNWLPRGLPVKRTSPNSPRTAAAMDPFTMPASWPSKTPARAGGSSSPGGQG